MQDQSTRKPDVMDLDGAMMDAANSFAEWAGLPNETDGDMSRAAMRHVSVAHAFHLLCLHAGVKTPKWVAFSLAMEHAEHAVQS